MVLIVRDRASARVLTTSPLQLGKLGLIGRLRLFIAMHRANALLRRTLKRRRAGPAERLSPHLLRDIGLPPDFRM